MAPPPTTLLTTTFLLAALLTLLVSASLRLLAILPKGPFKPKPLRKQPLATRVLVVLGSGGHTHEMFHLLRDLDTRKYTHRTYVVSSGDAFSSGRAVEFERGLEEKEMLKQEERASKPESKSDLANEQRAEAGAEGAGASYTTEKRSACVGPSHYDIHIIPRARRIHQSLLTTPFTSLYTLFLCFSPLFSSSSSSSTTTTLSSGPYSASAHGLPDLIITNGPATAVILVLASLILRFFDIRGANSRGKCKTVYVESFARVTSLSLSGRLLLHVVDRFLVQWKELEGVGGRAEFCGVLV